MVQPSCRHAIAGNAPFVLALTSVSVTAACMYASLRGARSMLSIWPEDVEHVARHPRCPSQRPCTLRAQLRGRFQSVWTHCSTRRRLRQNRVWRASKLLRPWQLRSHGVRPCERASHGEFSGFRPIEARHHERHRRRRHGHGHVAPPEGQSLAGFGPLHLQRTIQPICSGILNFDRLAPSLHSECSVQAGGAVERARALTMLRLLHGWRHGRGRFSFVAHSSRELA